VVVVVIIMKENGSRSHDLPLSDSLILTLLSLKTKGVKK